MFSYRGDAHKIYRQLNKTPNGIKNIKYLKETEEILRFYQSLDTDILQLIYYRMIKEKNATGMIPILVTAIPWLLFLFSNHLEEFLFTDGSKYWIYFSIIYLIGLTISVILHFREKAWDTFHIKVIQDILDERKNQS